MTNRSWAKPTPIQMVCQDCKGVVPQGSMEHVCVVETAPEAMTLAAQVDARLSGEVAPVVEEPVAVEVSAPTSDLVTYHALATDEAGLRTAQLKMVTWANTQIHACEHELHEEETALGVAKKNGWATKRYQTNANMLRRRVEFYEKLLNALEAGFVIVPNFEMDVFAIRVPDESKPPWQRLLVESWRQKPSPSDREAFRVAPSRLESGEGKYVNPIPTVWRASFNKTADGKEVQHYFQSASEWSAINFPAALARPVLMERVSAAMMPSVFDEIGVAVDSRRETTGSMRKGDPILLGRVRNPRPNRADVTFFLGWYFDPSEI